MIVPSSLARNCRKAPERSAWLERLPGVVRDLGDRWSLTIGTPFDTDEGGAAWVAPATLSDGVRAVLKIGMPHMEGDHEIAGLRVWNGDGTVRLLEADESVGAMLLERCEPGTLLRERPEPDQDMIVAGLLRRLWRAPADLHPFRPLTAMLAHWGTETLANAERWHDPGLVRAGLALFEELPRSASTSGLLVTDLHAGNILQARREPWLMIDPKPFVGDPAYDATQHLFNCVERLLAKPNETIDRFADLLCVDAERVRLWTFARAAAEPRDEWNSAWLDIARALSS